MSFDESVKELEKDNHEVKENILKWQKQNKDKVYEILLQCHEDYQIYLDEYCFEELITISNIRTYWKGDRIFFEGRTYPVSINKLFEICKIKYSKDSNLANNILRFLFVSNKLIINSNEYCIDAKFQEIISKKNYDYLNQNKNEKYYSYYKSMLIRAHILNKMSTFDGSENKNKDFYWNNENMNRFLEKEKLRLFKIQIVTIKKLENENDKNIKEQKKLINELQNLKNNMQNMDKNMMVIMTLFIAVIGFMTTNINVYQILKNYTIRRQLITIFMVNFILIYIISTIFIFIDYIVSFNDSKKTLETFGIG